MIEVSLITESIRLFRSRQLREKSRSIIGQSHRSQNPSLYHPNGQMIATVLVACCFCLDYSRAHTNHQALTMYYMLPLTSINYTVCVLSSCRLVLLWCFDIRTINAVPIHRLPSAGWRLIMPCTGEWRLLAFCPSWNTTADIGKTRLLSASVLTAVYRTCRPMLFCRDDGAFG